MTTVASSQLFAQKKDVECFTPLFPSGSCCGRSTLGAAVADKLTGDHQMAKNLLATLDTLSATDPQFDIQLRAR